MPQNSSHRIRESSSGALVGKNIAGIGNMNSIGKSSSNILKDEKINLAKINMMNNDPKKKFGTHTQDSNPTGSKRDNNYSHNPEMSKNGIPSSHHRNNL